MAADPETVEPTDGVLQHGDAPAASTSSIRKWLWGWRPAVVALGSSE